MADAELIPYSRRLYRNKPLWVLTTTSDFDCSSKQICRYAWLRSSFVKYLPPDKFENRSEIFGIGYLSNLATLLMVNLKSPQILTDVLSAFNTGTMGAAHYEKTTGSMIPCAFRLSNSFSTSVFIANGTDLA